MIVARHEVPGGHEENGPVPAGRLNFSTTNISRPDNDFDRPEGTEAFCIATQALRAWLLSPVPPGLTDSIAAPELALSQEEIDEISNVASWESPEPIVRLN